MARLSAFVLAALRLVAVEAVGQSSSPPAFLQLSSETSGEAARSSASVERRFISVADLHGDYDHARSLLQRLGLMNEGGNWSGGKDVLVQTGDVCDRGDHSKKIYEMLFQLQDEAPKAGGEVFLLLGNHELMSMQGDTRYATDADMDEFGGPEARAAAFGPNGWLGKRLRERGQIAALVGPEHGLKTPTLYVHGGMEASTLKSLSASGTVFSSLVESSSEHESKSSYAAGLRLVQSLNQRGRSELAGKDADQLQDDAESSALFSDSGPLWTRHLAQDKGICGDLAESLRLAGAERMVVGHTAQEDGVIHSRCDGRLVLADTMISAAYTGTSHPSAFEVLPSGVSKALYPKSKDVVEEQQPLDSEAVAAV